MQSSLTQKILRPFWFFFAALFLFEAWLWGLLGHALTRLAALIPLAAFKDAFARMIEVLPAPLVLLIFISPLIAIEPLNVLGFWFILKQHFICAALAFLAAKIIGLGLTAFFFEMTRTKLLSMGWFERFYLYMLRLLAWAHALLDPYRQRITQAIAPFKARLHDFVAEMRAHGGLGRKLTLLRSRVRRLRGLT
jgi:hypothetical protein